MFQDAVDWEKIPANPFSGLRASAAVPKSNVEVSRETIDAILPHCNQTWKTIIALSRYGGLRTPSQVLSIQWSHIDFENGIMNIPEPKVEHHEGRGIRVCPLFPELREVLRKTKAQATNLDDYVIDKPLYRKAANTGDGWKNANLRTQFLKVLKRAKVSPGPGSFTACGPLGRPSSSETSRGTLSAPGLATPPR
jgi:integrase